MCAPDIHKFAYLFYVAPLRGLGFLRKYLRSWEH